jgi:dephospho-CoA kinase
MTVVVITGARGFGKTTVLGEASDWTVNEAASDLLTRVWLPLNGFDLKAYTVDAKGIE